MATTNLNVRVDTELKKSAEKVFGELGMSLTTALTVFLRQSVRSNGIPFDLRLEVPNEETLKAIDDANNNRNMSKSFGSVRALMEALNADN